ncbi:Anti-sigma F factor [bacterium HR36]|nr:Anti-sigma F factor [bacterium HR36]
MSAVHEGKKAGNREYCWRLPSDLGKIPQLQQEIMQLLQQNGFPEPDVFAVRLAVEEAVANAMKHGNRLLPNKAVEVALGLEDDAVWVCVRDEGEGFDPNSVPDPTSDENLERASGRGILLMRHFMHYVEYRDNGRTVYMVRRRVLASGSACHVFCVSTAQA